MDKSLGTLLHFWGIFQFTQAQPLPSPHQRVSTLYGVKGGVGGGGEMQENFEKEALFHEGTQNDRKI